MNYEKIMDSGNELILSVLSYWLPLIAEDLNAQILSNWELLGEDEKYLASGNVSQYLQKQMEEQLFTAFAEITDASNKDVIDELNLTKVKFAEPPKLDKTKELDISAAQAKRIRHQADLYAEAVSLDLQGATYITLENNYMLSKSELDKALTLATEEFISKIEDGKATFIQSAGLVNDSRNDIFESAVETGEVQAFQFWNPNDDKTTDLCRELHGTTFTIDDPLYGFYLAPLHFNCRSTYLPIKKMNPDEVDGLPEFSSLSKDAQEQKQF